MEAKPRISIALCTYNGEKFLKGQLDSYLQQLLPPCEVVACDDASSDSTRVILEEFSHRAPFPVRIFHNEKNLGLIKNFSKAASLCTGDYIAFSDQDDIWLPDKLDACYRMMKKAEQEHGDDTPLLVHSDLRLIDSHNNIIAPSYLKVIGVKHVQKEPLKSILVRNFVLGCTSLCNKILIRESLPFPEIIMNHDGWVAMIAASRGKILFIPEAKVLYRHHDSNVTAWAKPFSYTEYLKALMTGRLSPDRDVRMQIWLLHQAEELERRLAALSDNVPTYLKRYIHALRKGGIMNTLNIILSGIRAPGFIPTLLFIYRIARGRHIQYIKQM